MALTWQKVRDVKPEELHFRLCLPRQERGAVCPNVDEAGEPCGMRLSDVLGLAGGPVCISCGVMYDLASDQVQ